MINFSYDFTGWGNINRNIFIQPSCDLDDYVWFMRLHGKYCKNLYLV